jgi:hypothetical protein
MYDRRMMDAQIIALVTALIALVGTILEFAAGRKKEKVVMVAWC